MRGQLAVEFFLIVSFSLLLAVFLLDQAETNLAANAELARVSLGKSALDAVVTAANAVTLQGNASRQTVQLFVPANAFCFVANATDKTLSCFLGAFTVKSHPYLAASAPSFTAGCFPTTSDGFWVRALVENQNGSVAVNCTRLD